VRFASAPAPRCAHAAAAARMLPMLCLALAGCATSDPIAHYPLLPAPQSLAVLNARAASIRDVSAQGLLTLSRAGGDAVRLDVALALQPPDRARLRAWKFGQAVFDLTVSPGGVWVVEPPAPAGAAPGPPAFGPQAAASTRRWLALLAGSFNQPRTTAQLDSARLTVRQPLDRYTHLDCDIDRSTLTPRSYTIVTGAGEKPFTLNLSHYANFNGTPWPTRIEAIGGSGRVLLELHDIQLNAGLPAAAFRPPRRADKVLGPPGPAEPAR
jgi:outer membrane lipoprotein-sorting protein